MDFDGDPRKQFLKIMSDLFVMVYCLRNQAKLELFESIKFKQLIGGRDRLADDAIHCTASFVERQEEATI